MAGSSFGNIFRITTWGESHGKGIGVVVDGCPAGLQLCDEDIQKYLDRRKPGQSKFTTQRNESDTVEILSGVFEGKTTGTPISMMVWNKDQHSKDYSEIASYYRPGHADLGFDTKYGLNLSVLDLEEKPNQPDYSECIVNLSNSILKHYGIPTDNASLPVADSILSKNKKHVVVVLLDGLGVNILQEHLHYKDFLRRNFICTYSSVFPPTTTASTTSFLSGKYPIEHGWLGWDLHFEQENKTVTCFKNVLQDSETPASTEYNVPFKYLPYESIIEKINKSGNAKAYQVATFGDEPCTQLDDWIKKIQNYCHKDERNFIYAYWNEPDHSLHYYGTKSKETIITRKKAIN